MALPSPVTAGVSRHEVIMINRIAILGIMAIVSFSCATRQLKKSERIYFRHLYYAMNEPFEESEDICHVHKVPTVTTVIRSYAGMVNEPDDEYIIARVRLFPNSFFYAMTGFCESGDWEIRRKVCPACRKAELNWLKAHGRKVSDEYKSSEGQQ